ncbi:MAG: S8 family serine peptidase [Desulfobacteraceae bacterium]
MGRIRKTAKGLLVACTLMAGLIIAEGWLSHLPAYGSQKPHQGFSGHVIEVHNANHPFSAEQIFYQDGRMTGKLTFWNNQPWERTLIEYLDDLSLYSIQTMIYHDEKIALVSKEIFQTFGSDCRNDQKIETWYYHFDKDKANSLRQVDTYWPDTTLVRERQVFDRRGGLKASALFEYAPHPNDDTPDENEKIASATRMTLINDDGAVVSDYREATDVDLTSLYLRHHFSHKEIARRILISQDPSRIPILVVDGGIDISHPELAYKLWKNPDELPNGADDDGNGLVDDIFGVSDNPRLGQPVHDLRLPRFGLPGLSHGTLVASIATEGREDVAIMAASELTANNSSNILTQIELFIKSHGVRYTNMSFIFDKQILSYDSRAQRPHNIKQLVHNTPETLHVVAAGNGTPMSGKGFNVDKHRQAGDLVPVMLAHDNILVVGALATDRLRLADYPTYGLAPFSNVGEVSVDILAPGTRMCGAQMGGGTICEDGTSFAAPYLLNHGVLNVAKANPDLDIYEIKEIVMKTAYVPDLGHPFPVRSGGILHPRRAVAVARWMADHRTDTVEAAVLAVRKMESDPIPGERTDPGYLDALQKYWADRNIGKTTRYYARP